MKTWTELKAELDRDVQALIEDMDKVKPKTIGERGPEIVVPETDATVLPMDVAVTLLKSGPKLDRRLLRHLKRRRS